MSSLIAIGCDGTAVNTGKNAGICMFHFNELPRRHLFTHLDGITAGPKAFTGALGKALPSCQSQDIVSFKAIAGDLPQITDFEILSKDQNISMRCVWLFKMDRFQKI